MKGAMLDTGGGGGGGGRERDRERQRERERDRERDRERGRETERYIVLLCNEYTHIPIGARCCINVHKGGHISSIKSAR